MCFTAFALRNVSVRDSRFNALLPRHFLGVLLVRFSSFPRQIEGIVNGIKHPFSVGNFVTFVSIHRLRIEHFSCIPELFYVSQRRSLLLRPTLAIVCLVSWALVTFSLLL